MRLILTMRGTAVVDLELRWPHKQVESDDGPTLQATGGGLIERAESYGDPATQHGFGFSA